MNPALLEIPFDHFQRYSTGAGILAALGFDRSRILEVGANRQRLLGQFLTQASLLYTDVQSEGDERDFVVADATQLPFERGSFDAVISLDVLEHIPRPQRDMAIAEMARVARGVVVIGCPLDMPWVHAAEADANGFWRELFGDDYEWLAEHKENGLVDADAVVSALECSGMQVMRVGHGEPALWASLMSLHFAKVKFPELEPLVEAVDRVYNGRVSPGDTGEHSYREYFIAVRPGCDVGGLELVNRISGSTEDEAISVLKGIASGVRSFALRAHGTEVDWAETARAMESCSTDLVKAKAGWTSSVRLFEECNTDLAEAKAGWSSSAHLFQECSAALADTKADLVCNALLLEKCRADLAEATSGWASSAQLVRDCSADLEKAKAEWSMTAKLLAVQATATEQAEKKLAEVTGSLAGSQVELESTARDLTVAKHEWAATADLLRKRESDLGACGNRVREVEELAAQQARDIKRGGKRLVWMVAAASAISFLLGWVANQGLM